MKLYTEEKRNRTTYYNENLYTGNKKYKLLIQFKVICPLIVTMFK